MGPRVLLLWAAGAAALDLRLDLRAAAVGRTARGGAAAGAARWQPPLSLHHATVGEAAAKRLWAVDAAALVLRLLFSP